MTEAAERAFEVRHVQLGRALLAAVAAVMVTFSPDHSAGVGLAIFSGWAIATALILLIAAWLVYPQGRRGAPILLGALTLVAGMITGLPGIRSVTLFFVVVIVWALATGAAGLAWLSVAFFGVYMLARLATLGWRVRRPDWLTAGA